MTNRQQIAGIAAAVLSGSMDPLIACRRIVSLIGDAERDDPDILGIRGIESETDEFPGPEQRALWDPAALAERDAEREAYLNLVGPSLRESCFRIAAKWRDG